MEAAITLPAGPTTGLFAELGGAIFRRAVRILGDEPAAARVAEELFVRFLVYGNAQTLDAHGRWNWIYRVVTTHALRQLPDDARPGGSAVGHGVPPTGRELGRLDEATQNILVLSVLDGLAPDEIAEVLGLPPERIRRRVAAGAPGVVGAGGTTDLNPETGRQQGPHPSTLALDRESELHAEHIATCDRCRATVQEAKRLTTHFAADLAPAAIPRVAAAVRAERLRRASGPRWRRLAWMGGGLAFVAALALIVARPRNPDRVDVPYAGIKGASRAKAAGIQIAVGHGVEIRPLEPASAVAPGDRLFFRVRVERPRYLELRVRDDEGERRLFPVGPGNAVSVQTGQALPGTYQVSTRSPAANDAGRPRPSQKVWIVGLFADHAFPLDRSPGPDIEVVPVPVEVQF